MKKAVFRAKYRDVKVLQEKLEPKVEEVQEEEKPKKRGRKKKND